MTHNIKKYHTYKHAALRLLLLLQLMMAGVTGAWATDGITGIPYSANFSSSIEPFDAGIKANGTNVSEVLMVHNTTATANFAETYTLKSDEVVTISFKAYHGTFSSGESSVTIYNSDNVPLVGYTYNLSSCTVSDVQFGGNTAGGFSEFIGQCYSPSGSSYSTNGLTGNGKPYLDNSNYTPNLTITISGSGDVSFRFVVGGRSIDKSYSTILSGIKMDLQSIKIVDTCTNNDRSICIDDLSITTTHYKYTINAVDGNNNVLTTVASDRVLPNTSVTISYPQLVLKDHILYEVPQNDNNPRYRKSYTISSDNIVETIAYTTNTVDNVVFLFEGEDIPGTNWGANNDWASKDHMGYCTDFVNVTPIQSGKYIFYWKGVNGNSDARNASVRVGNSVVGSFSFPNSVDYRRNFGFDVSAAGMLSLKSDGSGHSGVDWFYIQAVYAFKEQNGTVTWHGTSTPALVTPGGDDYATITYHSSNSNIASVDGNGTITGVHNGTAVITATANGGAVATYKVTVVDEPLATWTDVVSGDVETISASANGHLPWGIEGTNLDIGFSTEDAIRYIDDRYEALWFVVSDTEGKTEVTVSGTGLPLSGSFYKLSPKVNGTIKMHGASNGVRNGIRLTDERGQVLETILAYGYTDNYDFQTVLMAGRTYYVFAETTAMNGGGDATLVVQNFSFTKVDGLTISLVDQSLQFFPNNNANNNRLDRIIPGFKIEFGGGDNAKYQYNGTFIMRNGGGSVTITPVRKAGNEGDVTITDVRLTYSSPTDNPQVSVNDGVSQALDGTSHSWTGLTGHTVKIAQTNGSSSSFLLETITIRYTLSNGAELSTDLGTVGITIAGDGIVYGPTGSAQDADVSYSQPNLFYGDMSFSYTGSGFTNGNTVAPSKQNVDGDDLTHYKYYLKEGDNVVANEPYRVRIGSGLGRLTATYDGSFYFAPATASVRLYSQEYVETCNMTLAAGQSYTIPSTPGYQLTLYAHSASGEVTLRLDGTDRSSVTPQDERIVTYTSAGANRITLTNTNDHESIIIYQIEVSKPKVYANVVYPTALGSDHSVLFFNETYEIEERTPAIIDEGGNDITAYYDLSSKARTYSVNASGTTMNGSTFAITTGNEQGYVDVTYTYNVRPEYASTYANVSTTMRLYVSKGEWNFYNNYKAGNHNELNGSPTWSGSGYNQLQDNMYYSYVVKSNGEPMSQAVGLQTKYKLRFSWVKGNAVGGRLHLFGKGVYATNKSAWDHGGCLRVPVKKGMLVEITSVAADADNVEMDVVGLNDTEGNPVSTLTANLGDLTPQRFIAAQDGYFDIINSSFNQNYWIYKIKVSDDIVFDYTDNPLYLDPTINSPFTNRVVNQGESTINFSYANTANAAVTAFNTSTGNTEFSGYGKWTVTATGTSGLLNGKTASYNAISLGFTFNEPDPVNIRPEEYYEFYPQNQIVIDPGNMSDLYVEAIKNQVKFSVVSVSPETSFAYIDGNKLTIYGVADVVVEARLGAIVRQITYRVQGARLNDHHPVILNTQDEYLVYLEGTNANISNVSFNTTAMTAGIVGDLKTENIIPTYESTTYNGMAALKIKGLGGGIGGVIPIIATYNYSGVASPLTLNGTLTVAYSKKHWYFGRENLIDSLYNWTPKIGEWDEGDLPTYEKPDDASMYRDDSKAWRMVRKISGHTNVSMVYYYNRSQEGQNATIIPQTNGLHIHSTRAGRQLGVEMMVVHTGDVYPAKVDNGRYDCRNLMLLRGGRLIIPKVRPGQWIEVRWTRHNPDMAERMTMENLLDVEGKYISGTYKIGNCHYEMNGSDPNYHNYKSSSSYMFQVAGEADGITLDEDGCVDAVFAVQDNIYISFQEIILHEPGWEYKSSYQQKLNTTNSFSTTGDLSYQQLLNPGDKITINSPAYQNAPNAPTKWEIEFDETLTNAEKTQGDNPTITYNGGYGKAYVTLSSYSQDGSKYVANRNTWTITFGKKPEQTYPYTWDFTKYFSNTKDEVGSTENGHDDYFEEDDLYQALTTRNIELDLTSRILNPDFDEENTGWTMSGVDFASGCHIGGASNYNCAEAWHSTFLLQQNIEVPNGIYQVKAQGFYRMDSGSDTSVPYFFANGVQCNMPTIAGTENNMQQAAASFDNDLYTIQMDVIVTNGTLRIGVSNPNNHNCWCIWDNFTITKTMGDYTTKIVNPSFNSHTTTGWTLNAPNGGNAQLKPGTLDAIEYWAGGAGTRENFSFDYYQVLNVPNGIYKLGADMFNSLNSEGGAEWSATCCLYASSNGTEVKAMCDTEGETLNFYITPTIEVTNGLLRIGVKNTTTPIAARWFVADNFKLYMDCGSLLTYYNSSDYDNNKTAAHEYRKTLDTWTESGNTETVITANYDTPKYGSYFVDGAQLVSRKYGILPETEGLGFILLNKAIDGLTLDMQNTVAVEGVKANSSGETWREGKLNISGGGSITVPKPGADGFYIYLLSNVAPNSVTNTTTMTDDVSTADDTYKQYKYRFTDKNQDAVITFSGDAVVYAIGVTNIFKPITPIGGKGWATESRHLAIDHALTGYLTTNDVNAYAIIESEGNPTYAADKSKTTVAINDQRYVVPPFQGLVLKQNVSSAVSEYAVPLFVPAVTTANDDASDYIKNLMRPSYTYESGAYNAEKPSVILSSEMENPVNFGVSGMGTDYTRFILAKRYMEWKKENGTVVNPTGFESKEAAVFYRLHLYGGTQQVENSSLKLKDENGNDISENSAEELNTLGPNKAYLLLETSKINPAIWTSGSPSRPYIAILGVSDMDEDFGEQNAEWFPPSDKTYNLKGQPVNGNGHLRQGLYIRNGRKIVVKK